MEQRKITANLLNHRYIVLSFIGFMQVDRSKERCYNDFKKSLSAIKKNLNKEPLFIFSDSLNKCQPFCEIKSVRVFGSYHKVPVEINVKRQKILIYKWILTSSLVKSNSNLSVNFANEIVDTSRNSSKTIKASEDFHKAAESNKMYIRYYK